MPCCFIDGNQPSRVFEKYAGIENVVYNFGSVSFVLPLSRHKWSAAPITAYSRRGPRGYFRSEWCTGAGSPHCPKYCQKHLFSKTLTNFFGINFIGNNLLYFKMPIVSIKQFILDCLSNEYLNIREKIKLNINPCDYFSYYLRFPLSLLLAVLDMVRLLDRTEFRKKLPDQVLIQTASITAVKCLIWFFSGYKPDSIKYLDSITGLGSDWITPWMYWNGLGSQKYPVRPTLVAGTELCLELKYHFQF